jgi:hypothetical protein
MADRRSPRALGGPDLRQVFLGSEGIPGVLLPGDDAANGNR